ncbi:hypothetical protein L9F63_026854, partial [Diploptera punctata]
SQQQCDGLDALTRSNAGYDCRVVEVMSIFVPRVVVMRKVTAADMEAVATEIVMVVSVLRPKQNWWQLNDCGRMIGESSSDVATTDAAEVLIAVIEGDASVATAVMETGDAAMC